MTPALERITRAAYTLFDGPKPATHQACTACCMSPENHRVFFQVPRQNMTTDMLRDWSTAAFSTPASPELRRYLLPPILDALAKGQEVALSPELTLQRFQTGCADLWTTEENALIDAFVNAFLDMQADGPSVWGSLGDVLCLFARAGHDVGPLIGHVMTWPDASLVTKLHGDLFWGGRGIALWHSSFWEGDLPGLPEGSQAVLDWYRGETLRDRCLTVWLDEGQTDVIRSMANDLFDGLALL